MEQSNVYMYYKNVGMGYELIGDSILSGMDSFYGNKDAYLVLYCPHVDNLFVYHWDNSQKRRKGIDNPLLKEQVLIGLLKDVDDISARVREIIFDNYCAEELLLEAESNAN